MSQAEFAAKGYESFSSFYLINTLYIFTADKLFAVNANRYEVKDKGAELVSEFPQISTGIAKLKN